MNSHILSHCLDFSRSGLALVTRTHHLLRPLQPSPRLSSTLFRFPQYRLLSMKTQQKKKPSIALIKQLRSVSNAPIVDCREALVSVATEHENVDIDDTLQAAMAWLREKGRLRAASKAGRIAQEGLIGIRLHKDRRSAIIMELNCETDFVAKSEPFRKVCLEILDSALSQTNKSNERGMFSIPINDAVDPSCMESITQLSGQVGEKIELRRFFGAQLNTTNSSIVSYMHNKISCDITGDEEIEKLTSLGRIASVVLMQSESENEISENEEAGKLVAMHIVAENPTYVSRDSIPAEELQKLKDNYQQEANQGGKKKPAHIMQKIMDGKLNKFYKQNLLLEQIFSLDGEMEDSTNVQSFCEKVNAQPTDFLRLQVGEEN